MDRIGFRVPLGFQVLGDTPSGVAAKISLLWYTARWKKSAKLKSSNAHRSTCTQHTQLLYVLLLFGNYQ